MKIFHVTSGHGVLPPHEGTGPVNSVLYNLCKNLCKFGYNVTIIDGGKHEEKKTHDNISIVILSRVFSFKLLSKIKDCRIFRFIFEEISYIFFGYKVAKYFKKNGITDTDIIHVHTPVVGLVILAFNPILAYRMVYTSHVPVWTMNSKSFFERIILLLDVILMKRVKKVIALNILLKRKFISLGGIPAEKINIVNNGVDVALFSNVDTYIIEKKYKLNKFNILFVGRFDKVKGVKYLLKAANIIVNNLKFKNIMFILVGPHKTTTSHPSEKMSELIAYIKRYKLEDNILLTDYLPFDELRALYVKCDIVVVPSLAEADPLVTLEAMAAGKPVIGSNVGGIPNQIVDNHTGFLVEPANEYQIADKIYYLLKNRDKLKVLGENSRKRVEKYFTWEKVSKDLLIAYFSMRMS